jgi:hypothetical protein
MWWPSPVNTGEIQAARSRYGRSRWIADETGKARNDIGFTPCRNGHKLYPFWEIMSSEI